MAKHPRQGRAFERRNGAEGFVWEGIATKVDPAANPPNRPRDLVNVRTQGGVLISRPGFQGDGALVPLMPLHNLDGAADPTENPPFDVGAVQRWVPHWLAPHNSAGGVRLWMVAETTIANGFATLMYADPDSDKGFQTVASLRQVVADEPVPIEKFNNEIYIGDFGGLRKLYLVPSVEGATSPPIDTNMLADEVIVSYPEYRTGALQEHAALLFFAVVDGPSFGSIYSWDGLGVAEELVLTSAAADGVVMATFRDTLVVSVRDYAAPGQGSLLVRDATGAWTSHTLVGFQPSKNLCSMQEYGDLLYIMSGVDQIFTWDGATIALAHTISPGNASAANCCAKLSGRLYFGWTDNLNSILELGFVDKDNAPADVFQDVGTRAGVYPGGGNNIDAMAAYRGRLWLASAILTDSVVFWHSVQHMPYDGWQRSNDASVSFSNSTPGAQKITNMRML